MNCVRIILQAVEWLSEWSGRVAGMLVLVMIFVVCYNVFLRYVFLRPTIWSYDTNYMLGGSMMVIGLAVVLKHGGHVRIDILSVRFSKKTKLIIEIVFTLCVFIPALLMISRVYWVDVFRAIEIGETLMRSSWYPVSWPFKAMLATGFSLFLLQGMVNVIKDVAALVGGGQQPW